jgi:hypothetical protein
MKWFYVKWLITVTGKLVWAGCYTHVRIFIFLLCPYAWLVKWTASIRNPFKSNFVLNGSCDMLFHWIKVNHFWHCDSITVTEVPTTLYLFLRSIGERLFCIMYSLKYMKTLVKSIILEVKHFACITIFTTKWLYDNETTDLCYRTLKHHQHVQQHLPSLGLALQHRIWQENHDSSVLLFVKGWGEASGALSNDYRLSRRLVPPSSQFSHRLLDVILRLVECILLRYN